jgi:hypothetical protein
MVEAYQAKKDAVAPWLEDPRADSGTLRTPIPAHRGQRSGDRGQQAMTAQV